MKCVELPSSTSRELISDNEVLGPGIILIVHRIAVFFTAGSRRLLLLGNGLIYTCYIAVCDLYHKSIVLVVYNERKSA
jgi:hypothetical protein